MALPSTMKFTVPDGGSAARRAVLSSASRLLLPSAVFEEGAGLVCVCYGLTLRVLYYLILSGDLWLPHTGPSSVLFISAEDKKKIMALLLRRSGSVYTAEGLAGELQTHLHHITSLISLLGEKKNETVAAGTQNSLMSAPNSPTEKERFIDFL